MKLTRQEADFLRELPLSLPARLLGPPSARTRRDYWLAQRLERLGLLVRASSAGADGTPLFLTLEGARALSEMAP